MSLLQRFPLIVLGVHVVKKIHHTMRIAVLVVIPENTRAFHFCSMRRYLARDKKNGYQEMSFTNVGLSWIPAWASKMEELRSPMKSEDTTRSFVYSRIPFIGPSLAFLTAALMSS